MFILICNFGFSQKSKIAIADSLITILKSDTLYLNQVVRLPTIFSENNNSIVNLNGISILPDSTHFLNISAVAFKRKPYFKLPNDSRKYYILVKEVAKPEVVVKFSSDTLNLKIVFKELQDHTFKFRVGEYQLDIRNIKRLKIAYPEHRKKFVVKNILNKIPYKKSIFDYKIPYVNHSKSKMIKLKISGLQALDLYRTKRHTYKWRYKIVMVYNEVTGLWEQKNE